MYSQSCGSLYIFEGTFISNTHNHMQQYLISKLLLSPRSCRYLIVIFYVQKSQRRGQRAWKLTDRRLPPPQPSPFLQRISSAQSHLWPTQASLRGVSTVRTQHCGATCLPQSVLFLPPPIPVFSPHLTSGQKLLCHKDPAVGRLKPMISQICVVS